MRNAITMVLALLLAVPAAPSASLSAALKIKEKVRAMPGGSPIEVRLVDRSRLTGRLGAVSAAGFVLDLGKEGNLQSRDIAFQEVKSVKPHAPAKAMSAGVKAAWAILIVGGLVAAGIAVSCAASGNCSTN